MAASAACALSEGPRVALAPCLSNLTAEAMCDGAISLNMDWQALGGGKSGSPEVREKLYRLADRFGVLEVMKTNPHNRIGSLHQLIAPEDVIVALIPGKHSSILCKAVSKQKIQMLTVSSRQSSVGTVPR